MEKNKLFLEVVILKWSWKHFKASMRKIHITQDMIKTQTKKGTKLTFGNRQFIGHPAMSFFKSCMPE